MGAVYRAEHTLMQRKVAVKLLRPDLVDREESQKRFMREARLCAQLDHPNCVTVYDFGAITDDVFFLAMEYLEGESVAARLQREGVMTAKYAAEIFCQVLDALGAAHFLGIVHRDVKPANIMLIQREDGTERVKLLDFGIAKAPPTKKREEGHEHEDEEEGYLLETPITLHGLTVGTPEYIAPEQALGQDADGRADLYSLAVSLFEVLTGRLPFTSASPVAVVTAHVNEPPPRPSQLARPGFPISPELEQVILRGLAKRPEDRFMNAEEFRQCLLEAVPDAIPTEVSVRRRLPEAPPGGTNPQISLPPPEAPQEAKPRAPLGPLPEVQGPTSSWRMNAVSGDLAFRDEPPPSLRPTRRSGVALFLTIFLGVILLGFGGWYAMTRLFNGAEAKKPTSTQAGSFPVEIDLRPTEKLLATRDFAGAIEQLTPILEKSPRAAEAHLLLGHAHTGLEDSAAAQKAYFQAIKLELSLCNDDTLLLNIIDMLNDKDEALRDGARGLLVFCGERVVPALTRAITTDERKRVKQQGLQALNTMAQYGLDLIPAYTEALAKSETCEQRLIWVKQLHATMDPRALAPLKLEEKREGGKCLKNELSTAIKELKKRQ